MISRVRERAPRLLLWSFLISLVVHFTAGPLLAWLFGARFIAARQREQPIETITMTSSAVHFERRPRPRSPVAIQPPQQQPQPKPQPVRRSVQPRPRSAPPRRELARINPRAELSLPRVSQRHSTQQSFNDRLAQQQAMYTQTIEKLRRQSNPIISAAHPMPTPAAPKRYVYDFSGNIGSPIIGQGILVPLKDWQDGPYDYYYVRYWVIYPDGTNETGIVPWPIHFPKTNDPIRLGYTRMPLPGPPPDYVLPAGYELHPLAAFCYKHRFYSCPIFHD
ncbi:MAG TPA: hypothetical protein VGR69_06965 [Candidatus Rubrimentiphilum sp.]|nr:hypothetical protein [Candidatus Rubrimentiphilum sp.]